MAGALTHDPITVGGGLHLTPSGGVQTCPDGLTRALASVQAASAAAQSRLAAASPYRLISYGDSRANGKNALTAVGITGVAGANVRPERVPGWVAASLLDTEYVGDFGIGGDTLAGWDLAARANSKTIANALALAPDLVHIQYGANDIGGWNGSSPTQAALTATMLGDAKALCYAFMSAGVKVIFESCNPFDPTAASSAFATFTTAKEQIRRDFNTGMQTWLTGASGRAIFANTDPELLDTATGYGRIAYIHADTLGVHLNRQGAQVAGIKVATVARAMLPQRFGVLSSGPVYQPNLIPADAPSMFTSTEAGTVTATTPTWNILAADMTVASGAVIPAGTPYAEVSFTATALASGTARSRLEIHAAGISGGSPLYPIAVGDMVHGGGVVVIDNGTDGGLPTVQGVNARARLYSATSYTEWGGLMVTDQATMPVTIAGRFATPSFVTTVASAAISAVAVAAGFPLQIYIEQPVTGSLVRVRVFAPFIRVVSKPQPSAITPGASPYTYTLTDFISANEADVIVGGGTVSAIGIQRGSGTAITTGLIAGAFRLSRGDSLVVTYTVAPTMTLVPR